MKTLYITDLDGTLLNSKAELTENCKEKLNKLIADGAIFSIATARTYATVSNLFKDVKLNTPYILMNGVILYDPISNNNISVHDIDHSVANDILEIYKKHNYSPMLYFLRNGYLEITYNKIHNKYQNDYISARDNLKKKIFTKVDGGFVLEKSDSLVYIVSLEKKKILSPVYQEISSLKDIYCAFYSDNYTDCNFMECMSINASKGNATKKIKEFMSVDRVVAFGDNINDIPLFLEADERYAVSNACDELKALATSVIASNDEDGVINYIYNDFYKKRQEL